MPITIIPSDVQPRRLDLYNPATCPQHLLPVECSSKIQGNVEVHMGSFDGIQKSDHIIPSSGSFIRGAVEAWAKHLHLVITPEIIWFTILSQLSIYMDKNAESIRHLFVTHSGQEEIFIEHNSWEEALACFSGAIQSRVKTPWLEDWIMPNFTTTTENDKMIANIFMMGLMQKYFTYGMGIICGLPSVTLMGEREDWVQLLAKLDRLPEFGEEPMHFANGLRPVLSRFVHTFDAPNAPETKEFWNQIVKAKHQTMCGWAPWSISGWVMAFCFWDAQGNDRGARPRDERLQQLAEGKQISPGWRSALGLDDQYYMELDIDEIPSFYAIVPVKMRDFENVPEYDAVIIAGALGKKVVPGAPEGYDNLLRAKSAVASFHQSREAKGSANKWAVNNTSGVDFSLPIRQEKQVLLGTETENVPLQDQGTLQPIAGWMLFGPEIPRSEIERAEFERQKQGNKAAAPYVSSKGELSYLEDVLTEHVGIPREHQSFRMVNGRQVYSDGFVI